MPQYLSTPLFQASDASANPLVGAKEYIYQTGTTTLLSLFSDELLTTPISNPLIADSAGVFPLCFIAETKFKVVLKTSADVTLYTRDPVYSTGQADVVSASNVSFDGTGIGFSSTNVQDAIVELYGSGVTLSGGSSTDNAVPRFDGTSGKIQNSAVLLDDSNNVTGVVGLTASGDIKADAFLGTNSTNNVIIASSTGAGTINFRPQGKASSTGAMSIDNSGNVVIAGALTLAGQLIASVSSAEITRTTSTAIHIGKTAGNLTNAGTSFFATGASDGLFQCTRDGDIVGQFNRITSTGTLLEFMTAGVARGSISSNGSTTSFNTSSDRRLKENRRDFDAGAILDQIKVWEFDWKEDGSVGHGVMAQEAVKAYPQAISRPQKRRQKWQADYSKYVPLLIREIQRLREEVKALKS